MKEDQHYYVERDSAPRRGVKWAGLFAREDADTLAESWAKDGYAVRVVHAPDVPDPRGEGTEHVVEIVEGNREAQRHLLPIGQDRREHQRHEARADVLVVAKDGQPDRFWAATRDISRGGMFVITTNRVFPDTVLTTKIVPRDSHPIRAGARVVRSAEGVGFGCCFIDLSPRSSAVLDRWLGRSGGLSPVSGTIET